MMDDYTQLSFDLFTGPAAVHSPEDDPRIAPPVDDSLIGSEHASAEEALPEDPSEKELPPAVSRKMLQRSVLGWLAEQDPTAAALHVPTRLARFTADAAAFWTEPSRVRFLKPKKTLIAEVCLSRMECWPDCSGKEETIRHLRFLQDRRNTLEAEIRRTEPHLRNSDMLFPEVEEWDYASSRNAEYASCIRKLEECEYTLYHGSRFELISRACIANEQYLAVPENVVHPDELADGWGLLYIYPDFSVKVMKPSPYRSCPMDHMLHLSQNIAASSLHDVLFANGVLVDDSGHTQMLRPPKRRIRMTSAC